VTYLPEFATAEPDTSARITVRQLLSHTSGFEGDVFKDTGRGDDAVERLVAEILPTVAQTLAPGVMFSYNNAGFCVLGRIVEVVRGTTWAAAIHEEIAKPLGARVATDAYEAILHRAAVGHVVPGPDADPEVVLRWGLPSSNGPAGAMLSTSARELLAFARMHLDGGLAADGTRVLSEDSVRRMRRPEVDVPRRTVRAVKLGLGWHLFDWPGADVIGHDGSTVGQGAFLRLVPEKGVAVAMLTNGGGDLSGLFQDVFGHVLAELAGVEMPPGLGRPENPVPVGDPGRYTGSYESGLNRFDVSDEDGRLWIVATPGPDIADFAVVPPRRELLRVEADLFFGDSGEDAGMPYVFVGSTEDGLAAYLHNHRANPRIA